MAPTHAPAASSGDDGAEVVKVEPTQVDSDVARAVLGVLHDAFPAAAGEPEDQWTTTFGRACAEIGVAATSDRPPGATAEAIVDGLPTRPGAPWLRDAALWGVHAYLSYGGCGRMPYVEQIAGILQPLTYGSTDGR